LRNRGEERGGWRRKGGQTDGPGLAARGERKGRWEWAGGALWAKRGGVGPCGPKGEGGRGLGGVWVFLYYFFQTPFSFLFKPFQTQNFEIELFSNFSIFLKHFKASHQQTKTPCIQIMIHKHLLLLNY
jgi:hypothetical protein